MNRKKITLLLTGLVVASGMMTGCSSSNDKADNSSQVAQEEGLRRASERTITEYKGNEYPDIAYADDILDVDQEDINNRVNSETNSIDGPYNYDLNTQDTNNNGLNNSDNKSIENPLNGFGGSTEDINDIDFNNFSSNGNINTTSPMMKSDENDLNNNTSESIISSQEISKAPSVGGSAEGIAQIPQTLGQDNNEIVDYDINTQENLSNNKNEQQPKGQASQVESKVIQQRSQVTSAGEIIPVRSVGGVELTGPKERKIPQGTIKFSFKLNGDVLNMQCKSASSKTLNELIQLAYEETLQDANGEFKGTPTLTNREALAKGLGDIFGVSTSITGVNLLFQDSKGLTVNIPYSNDNLFPKQNENGYYVRHIIDLDGMDIKNNAKTMRTISSDIPISLLIRNKKVDQTGNDELKTNTTYNFIGINGADVSGGNLPIEGSKVVTGLSIPTCTTGKAPSTIEVKNKGDGASQIYEVSSGDFSSSAGEATTGTLYVTRINKKYYLDTKGYLFNDVSNVSPSGTSINFPNIIFKDPDDSITSIEIEDVDGKKYPCTLVPVNIEDDSKGKYLKITGLRTETPYVFTNIYVNSNANGREETTTKIQLMEKGASNATVNTQVIKTVGVSTPKIELAAAGGAQKVKLPGGLEVQAVKNDATSLRYIVKVDNADGNIGDLRVTSLREGEESKVEKIVDKKAKVNYYIITLSNLSKSTDYNFVTLELDYIDYNGNKDFVRTSLSNINDKKKDTKVDNITENEPITGTDSFSVDIKTQYQSEYFRSAEVPVFLDDMNGTFVRMDFIPPSTNPQIQAEYEGSYINVTGLKPNSTETINLSFIYKDGNGNEKELKKYVMVTTPLAGDLDIVNDIAEYKDNNVTIKLSYASTPRSQIKSVVVKDDNGKEISSTWDSTSNSIILTELDPNKQYSDLVATFTLENTNSIDYPLKSFTTGAAVVKPTGPVADFVARVYNIALGREPEVEGWNYWIKMLENKEISATEFIAENLMTQPEFVNRELNKSEFVTTMYSLIVNRQPDEEGQKYWEDVYNEYRNSTLSVADLRIKIAKEMMNQPEFKELVSSLGLKY